MSNVLLRKFRGKVVNIDPMQIGRVQVVVPEVDGLAPAWAMPCLPAAGANSGMFAMPSLGSAIWVEFEQGDRNRPIWVGGFWNKAADVPGPAHSNGASQSSLVISDLPGPNGGISIRTAAGAMISVSDAGIVITNGLGAEISIRGPTVDVNSGALTVI